VFAIGLKIVNNSTALLMKLISKKVISVIPYFLKEIINHFVWLWVWREKSCRKEQLLF